MSVSQILRQATGEDAIDGVVPRHVALPESAEEFAQVLSEASREKQHTVLRGGGSKLGCGRVPSRVDLVIGTEKLDQLIAHRHGDMTVTAQAGMPLVELNRRLVEYRQYLPVESAFLEKPFDQLSLLRAVRALLDQPASAARSPR